jgi:pimeloyl-ACP methyl ester carboxylesterase
VPTVTTPEGINIRYEEFGSGRPLVLAHGFGVSHDMWWPQVDALSRQYRLITWDARGHGASSAPRNPESYSMPALAGDLRALLEELGAVEGAIIGGMSFGGQIALQYTVDHPKDVHALILSDSTTRGDAAPIVREVPYMLRGDHGLEGAFAAMDTRPDLTPQLPSLAMPALVIYGEQDSNISEGIPRLAEELPVRRIVCLRGCSHGTSAQRPEDWAQAVLRFLDDVEAGRDVHGEETL